MKISKLKKFDAAEHLQTPEARTEYLNMVLADGHPDEVRDAINIVARAEGMSKVAKKVGVTREGLYKALGENGNPEFATVMKVIGALGFRLAAHTGQIGADRDTSRRTKKAIGTNRVARPSTSARKTKKKSA
jgi:probable addiction module antidote protein